MIIIGYLKKIKALTGLDEAELPPNIVIFGMRRDAENLHRIGDMTITTSSMGNMYDAVSTGTPMLCLAPDIITADNSAKLSRLLSEATTDTDRQKLVDRLAVMMETAPERALNLMMVASAYAEKGIDPNDAVFDISTLLLASQNCFIHVRPLTKYFVSSSCNFSTSSKK